jgi:hypothetical protein
MEARIRQRVVESRRKKKTSGENAAPTTKADLPCADPSASHLPPSDRTDHGEMAHHPPANSSSQSILGLLAAQQQRLAEEIACAKAQLERVKPKSKSTADKRSVVL